MGGASVCLVFFKRSAAEVFTWCITLVEGERVPAVTYPGVTYAAHASSWTPCDVLLSAGQEERRVE